MVRAADQQVARHHADETGVGAVVPVATQKKVVAFGHGDRAKVAPRRDLGQELHRVLAFGPQLARADGRGPLAVADRLCPLFQVGILAGLTINEQSFVVTLKRVAG